MKIDNFTTARCRKCGWIKQFHPGREYSSDDFVCNCNAVKEEESLLDKLKSKADSLGVSYAHNITQKTLEKKIKEVADGNKG